MSRWREGRRWGHGALRCRLCHHRRCRCCHCCLNVLFAVAFALVVRSLRFLIGVFSWVRRRFRPVGLGTVSFHAIGVVSRGCGRHCRKKGGINSYFMYLYDCILSSKNAYFNSLGQYYSLICELDSSEAVALGGYLF
jgi:hypothetical protein